MGTILITLKKLENDVWRHLDLKKNRNIKVWIDIKNSAMTEFYKMINDDENLYEDGL